MGKTQAERDDDIRYRNRFREGGDDEPMARHKKKVWDRSTGTFVRRAIEMDKSPPKKGSGALAKRRKAVIDSNVKKGTGN